MNWHRAHRYPNLVLVPQLVLNPVPRTLITLSTLILRTASMSETDELWTLKTHVFDAAGSLTKRQYVTALDGGEEERAAPHIFITLGTLNILHSDFLKTI